MRMNAVLSRLSARAVGDTHSALKEALRRGRRQA